ncbi:MAG TPA: MFS transporter [Candidatus Limnocylindrales bacterium]|nr:MFS transporter [Candidatus Limnocylindrales bacterium]
MSQAVAAPRVSSTAVFKKRDFVLLWLAQLVSTAGSSLTDLAAAIYVYDRTGSAFLVGVTLMATAIPTLLVGLIAGVFVDRYDRRSVMIASNLGQAIVVAIIPFLIGVDVALLFVAILINAGVKQFFDPAYEAVIPEIATDEELTAANAFLQIASFGSTAIGFAGAGLIASVFDINWAFWIDSLTFLFSAACIWFLKVRSKPDTGDEGASVGLVVQNLRLGIRAIIDTPMLRNLFLIGAPVFLSFGLWNVLLLPMAIRELGATEFEYGLQEGLTSVGFVIGSLFMAKYADRLQTGLWVFIGTLGMGIAGVFYGLSPTITIAIFWVMVSGFFNSPSAVARQTLLQRHTPRELRGRVFSALFVMRDVIFLAGMAGAGLADVFNVRALIVLASLILVGVGIVALFVPGIGRPAAEWRRAAAALRAARAGGAAPAPVAARAATAGDFDRLVGRLATFSRLNDTQRAAFIAGASVTEVPEGARVIAQGDAATSAYFILDGQAAAGIPEPDGGYRGLSTMDAGDFFGEIGALTGSTRTADVVATRPSTLMEVPADSLRAAMEEPEVNKLLLSTLTERLLRSNQPDLPRLASMDQAALRDLRTKAPTVEALPKAYAEG